MAVNLNARNASGLRILVVAANPTVSSNDHLEEEANLIREALAPDQRIRPEIHSVNTLIKDELFQACERFRPDLIDITSHGSPSRKMLLEGQRGWVRNISGDTLVQGLKRTVGKIDCLLFNNCNVSRNFRALSQVASVTARFLSPSSGIDVSPFVARGFFSSLREKLDFQAAANDFTSTLEGEEQFRGIKADVVIEEPATDGILTDSDDKLYSPFPIMPDLARSNLPGDSEAPEPIDDKGPRTYRVWYGTNRRPVSADSAGITYGSERDTAVHVGYCDVTIPKYHTIGSIGDPWWRRFQRFWRNNRLDVQQRIELIEDRYWQDLHKLIQSLAEEDRVLLLFVHGYNVTFDQAAVRAAQLGFDLSIRGATAFFSWPSQGQLKGYAADVAAIEASEEALGKFIVEMVSRNELKKAHLIAHSMGNRGLLRALSEMVNRFSDTLPISLQQIFLAAPDVDTGLFARLATVYPRISTRTTMYVSDKDKALWSSGVLHDFPRAGYVPPITVVNGIDTIHVSAIDLTFLGHGYIAEARPLLQDMYGLIESDAPPDRRFGLEKSAGKPIYWRIRR
jgi:esterase/lipase superfamily enzyme